ncbi:hypothetical protein [Actinophytocola sediminis]
MDPIVVLGIVLVLGIVVGVAIRYRRRSALATHLTTPVCVFCLRPIAGTDQVAAMKKTAVRDLLGRVPSTQSPSTDPLGNPRWLGHVDCASRAGADLRVAGKVAGKVTDGSAPRGADPMELTCPACGHGFRKPDVVITTEAVARRYGSNAEQCPRCDHIWDPGGPPRHIIRG